MLELRNVTYRYPQAAKDAVHELSLVVAPGEHVCLMGSNGSGKSTIARIACADLLPDSGDLVVDGVPADEPGCGGAVSMVGQDPREQVTSILVAENVSFGPRCQLLDEVDVMERVARALADCGIEDLADRSIAELSGGQMQLVILASALATHARYIILDEASSHLDRASRERLADVVRSLRENGIGILQVTHRVMEAMQADRILVMDEGSCVWQGTPSEWTAWRQQSSATQPGDTCDIGPLDFLTQDERHTLSLQHVSRSYGTQSILRDLSIDIAPGELLLLCGPSGSGKTTAALLLAGVDQPDEGTVLIGGRAVRAGEVGLAFQRPEDQLFASNVWEDVAYGPRNMGVADDAVEKRVRESLEALRVPEQLWYEHAQHLSGGMRHRVALASIVALAPKAFVLDEPTAGLDEQGENLLHKLVAQVRAAGCPVVLVTHDPEEWADEATRTLQLCGLGEQVPSQVTPMNGVRHLVGRDDRQRSALSIIDARVRFAVMLAATVAIFATQSFVAMGCAALAIGVFASFAHVELRKLKCMLLPAVPILLAVLLADSLRIDGTGDMALTAHVGLSHTGLLAGSMAVSRIVLVVCLLATVLADTTSTDIISVVNAILVPFERMGLRTADISMTLSIALGLIPQTFDEFFRIAYAQRARGAQLDDGNPVRRLRAWCAVMAPLVVVLFSRADALARAMRLHGYRGKMTQPRRHLMPRDWIALVLSIAAAVALTLM